MTHPVDNIMMWVFIVISFAGCAYAASREDWSIKDFTVVCVFAALSSSVVAYFYLGGYHVFK